jgi:hypothetical protein
MHASVCAAGLAWVQLACTSTSTVGTQDISVNVVITSVSGSLVARVASNGQPHHIASTCNPSPSHLHCSKKQANQPCDQPTNQPTIQPSIHPFIHPKTTTVPTTNQPIQLVMQPQDPAAAAADGGDSGELSLNAKKKLEKKRLADEKKAAKKAAKEQFSKCVFSYATPLLITSLWASTALLVARWSPTYALLCRWWALKRRLSHPSTCPLSTHPLPTLCTTHPSTCPPTHLSTWTRPPTLCPPSTTHRCTTAATSLSTC